VPYAVAYFYNVYGPRERPAEKYGTLIETFIQKIRRGEKLSVVSPGTQKRNFTHVHDIVSGLVLVGEHGAGDDYGIGHDRSYSILEVAELFGRPVEMLPTRPGNRMDSSIDTSKVRILGWEPKHDLGEYIKTATSQ
jgi:UDP-glucose 4-epimerase